MKPDDRSAWLHSIESARTVTEQGPTAAERRQMQRQRQFMHQLVGITGNTVNTTTTTALQRQRRRKEDPRQMAAQRQAMERFVDHQPASEATQPTAANLRRSNRGDNNTSFKEARQSLLDKFIVRRPLPEQSEEA